MPTYEEMMRQSLTRSILGRVENAASWLDRLEALSDMRTAVDEWTRVSVHAARADDVSWDDIGESLGITRQAAWQRYHTAADVPEELADRLFKAELKAAAAERDLVIERAQAEIRAELDDDDPDLRERLDAVTERANHEFMQKVTPVAEAHLAEWRNIREIQAKLRAMEDDDE